MKKENDREPAFFEWIRAVREEMDRDTEGMTPAEWTAYIRRRAEKARRSLRALPPEDADGPDAGRTIPPAKRPSRVKTKT